MNTEEVKKLILNSFREKNNSHAFLLVTNNIDRCLSDVTSIVKKINCLKDGSDACDCNVCITIDSLTNPDFIVVKPDGKEIKKDQVLNVISSFNTKPVISQYSIYVLCEADKMNDASANKILKFLEEPEERIVGFFITDKLNAVIPTIKSRCEIYNYHFGNASLLDVLEINEEEYASCYNMSFDLLKRLNGEPKFLLMADSKNIAKKERSEIDLLFHILWKFYVIKYENVENNLYNDLDYLSPILETIETNDISVLVKRIKILDNIINDLSVNVNKELVINKFFLIWE